MSAPIHYMTRGRFNLLSNDEEEQVVLRTAAGNVSALFPAFDSEYDDSLPPSHVLDLIEARISSYLFLSDKKEKLDRISSIRSRIHEFDAAWCHQQSDRLEQRAKQMRQMALAAEDEIHDAAVLAAKATGGQQ
jgi:hypothetical protein